MTKVDMQDGETMPRGGWADEAVAELAARRDALRQAASLPGADARTLADAALTELDAAIEALGHPRDDPRGIGFSQASDGIWLEGTAFAAIALRRAGDSQRAARFLATLRTSRTKSGYVLATTAPRLATGLTTGPGASSPAVTYYPVPALAPTAWAALAAARSNPLAKKS